MTNPFDRIRLDIARRYIELAESGQVTNDELDIVKQAAAKLEQKVKPKKGKTKIAGGPYRWW